MSEIVTVHGPYTWAVQKQADDPESPGGPLATHVNITSVGLTVSWVGGEAPSNVAELRSYVAGDIYVDGSPDASTWVGLDGGGAAVTLATGRSYYWDGSSWVEGTAPAA